MATLPPSPPPTIRQVVFVRVDVSSVPLSWEPPVIVLLLWSKSVEWNSVTWISPTIPLQTPVDDVGLTRLNRPPSSDSRRLPAASKRIRRESGCGAVLGAGPAPSESAPVSVIGVH